MKYAVLLMMVLVPTLCQAQVMVVRTDSGYYVLMQDEDGSLSKVAASYKDLRPGGEDPDDPDPPEPPGDGDLSSQIEAAARRVDEPLFAKAMGILYDEVSKAVESGRIAPSEAPEKLKKGTEQFLAAISKKDDEWKSVVRLIERAADSRLSSSSSKSDWVSFLDEVSDGFEKSAEGAAIEDLEKWIELIMTIIRLILGAL